jgi:hypothetical protein
VTVDQWYPLEGGQGSDAWVRLIVKHHDPSKMNMHLCRTLGLGVLLLLLALLIEFLASFVLPTGVGFVVGGILASFLPKRMWSLYLASFNLFPYLNPLMLSAGEAESVAQHTGWEAKQEPVPTQVAESPLHSRSPSKSFTPFDNFSKQRQEDERLKQRQAARNGP